MPFHVYAPARLFLLIVARVPLSPQIVKNLAGSSVKQKHPNDSDTDLRVLLILDLGRHGLRAVRADPVGPRIRARLQQLQVHVLRGLRALGQLAVQVDAPDGAAYEHVEDRQVDQENGRGHEERGQRGRRGEKAAGVAGVLAQIDGPGDAADYHGYAPADEVEPEHGLADRLLAQLVVVGYRVDRRLRQALVHVAARMR